MREWSMPKSKNVRKNPQMNEKHVFQGINMRCKYPPLPVSPAAFSFLPAA